MSGEILSTDEKYRILSFTKLEPIAIVGVEAYVIRFQLPLVNTTKRLEYAIDVMGDKLGKIEKEVA